MARWGIFSKQLMQNWSEIPVENPEPQVFSLDPAHGSTVGQPTLQTGGNYDSVGSLCFRVSTFNLGLDRVPLGVDSLSARAVPSPIAAGYAGFPFVQADLP